MNRREKLMVLSGLTVALGCIHMLKLRRRREYLLENGDSDSNSCTSSNDDDHECDICGKCFDDAQLLKMHHTKHRRQAMQRKRKRRQLEQHQENAPPLANGSARETGGSTSRRTLRLSDNEMGASTSHSSAKRIKNDEEGENAVDKTETVQVKLEQMEKEAQSEELMQFDFKDIIVKDEECDPLNL